MNDLIELNQFFSYEGGIKYNPSSLLDLDITNYVYAQDLNAIAATLNDLIYALNNNTNIISGNLLSIDNSLVTTTNDINSLLNAINNQNLSIVDLQTITESHDSSLNTLLNYLNCYKNILLSDLNVEYSDIDLMGGIYEFDTNSTKIDQNKFVWHNIDSGYKLVHNIDSNNKHTYQFFDLNDNLVLNSINADDIDSIISKNILWENPNILENVSAPNITYYKISIKSFLDNIKNIGIVSALALDNTSNINVLSSTIQYNTDILSANIDKNINDINVLSSTIQYNTDILSANIDKNINDINVLSSTIQYNTDILNQRMNDLESQVNNDTVMYCPGSVDLNISSPDNKEYYIYNISENGRLFLSPVTNNKNINCIVLASQCSESFTTNLYNPNIYDDEASIQKLIAKDKSSILGLSFDNSSNIYSTNVYIPGKEYPLYIVCIPSENSEAENNVLMYFVPDKNNNTIFSNIKIDTEISVDPVLGNVYNIKQTEYNGYYIDKYCFWNKTINQSAQDLIQTLSNLNINCIINTGIINELSHYKLNTVKLIPATETLSFIYKYYIYTNTDIDNNININSPENIVYNLTNILTKQLSGSFSFPVKWLTENEFNINDWNTQYLYNNSIVNDIKFDQVMLELISEPDNKNIVSGRLIHEYNSYDGIYDEFNNEYPLIRYQDNTLHCAASIVSTVSALTIAELFDIFTNNSSADESIYFRVNDTMVNEIIDIEYASTENVYRITYYASTFLDFNYNIGDIQEIKNTKTETSSFIATDPTKLEVYKYNNDNRYTNPHPISSAIIPPYKFSRFEIPETNIILYLFGYKHNFITISNIFTIDINNTKNEQIINTIDSNQWLPISKLPEYIDFNELSWEYLHFRIGADVFNGDNLISADKLMYSGDVSDLSLWKYNSANGIKILDNNLLSNMYITSGNYNTYIDSAQLNSILSNDTAISINDLYNLQPGNTLSTYDTGFTYNDVEIPGYFKLFEN